MKICILTQPLHTNYGGLLQAYALQIVLKRMGHEVVTDLNGSKKKIPYYLRILLFCHHLIKRYILLDKHYNPFQFFLCFLDKKSKIDKKQIAIHTNEFITQYISTVDFFCGKTYPKKSMLDEYDALIVGSDQVWRPKYSFVPAYFLNFSIRADIQCIAYAASFGLDNMDEYTNSLINLCRKNIQRFKAVSVREDTGVVLCERFFGVKAKHLLDPTLLLEKEDYLTILKNEPIEYRKTLMCYVLDKTSDKLAIVQQVAKKMDLIPVEVMPEEKYLFDTQDVTRCIFPSVLTWLAGFRDAKFVVTDSFHGTVFSIIFNKPFITIVNKKRGNSRFVSLLKIFNLENRLISSVDELEEQHFFSIDYSAIDSIKYNWKEKSLNFLKLNLKKKVFN